MNRATLCGLLVAVICCAAKGSQAAPVVNSVGSTNRPYLDDNRMNWEHTAKRPLNTTIWYPTEVSVDKRQRRRVRRCRVPTRSTR
jgi:hypothetical protein